MIGLAVLGATSAEGEGTSRVSVHKPGLHTNLKLDGSLWRTQGKHGRVAAVPRTLVKGLFSEPRRGDDSCGRASQASAGAFSDRAGLLYAIFRRVSVLSWFSRNQDSVVHFETHGCEDRFSRKVDFQPALDPRARARAANSQEV